MTIMLAPRQEPEVDAVSDDISANSYPVSCLSYGVPLWLRGGCHSDDDDSEDNADERKALESDSAGLPGKHKRKMVQPPRPSKRPSKGKNKASDNELDSETAIRVTCGGKTGTKGMFVDEESYFYDALEFWDMPAFCFAHWQARSRIKATEKANADGGKKLRGKLRKSQQQIATRDAEIKCLQAEVDALQEHQALSPSFFINSPPNSLSWIPRTRGSMNYQVGPQDHRNGTLSAAPGSCEFESLLRISTAKLH
ncbi:hypothetical protein C8R45DRAFT_945839 [Mycena sanguinolenta]|nr:hypothetical protein C8R45DRAFT_945839 [Mycena sanguinolenta]